MQPPLKCLPDKGLLAHLPVTADRLSRKRLFFISKEEQWVVNQWKDPSVSMFSQIRNMASQRRTSLWEIMRF
jgi:hypothetical protein